MSLLKISTNQIFGAYALLYRPPNRTKMLLMNIDILLKNIDVLDILFEYRYRGGRVGAGMVNGLRGSSERCFKWSGRVIKESHLNQLKKWWVKGINCS